jgi:hypothetical protein
MTFTASEKFRQAAIDEGGQPVSAGGPPYRKLPNGKSEADEDAKAKTPPNADDNHLAPVAPLPVAEVNRS